MNINKEKTLSKILYLEKKQKQQELIFNILLVLGFFFFPLWLFNLNRLKKIKIIKQDIIKNRMRYYI